MKKLNSIIHLQSLISILILPFFFMLIFSNIFFILKLSINEFIFPISLVISFLTTSFYTKKICYVEFSLGILIYILSFFTSIFFYDNSSDGQWYHLETIINLKNGWNPVYEVVKTNIAQIYVQSYPKGHEIISTCIYTFTNKVESGKLINIVAVAIAITSIYNYLNVLKINSYKKILYTFLICFNPIVVTEMFTYYLDGFTYLILISLICSFIALVNNYNKILLTNFIALLAVLCSLKFTVLLLIFIFSLITFIYLWKNKKFSLKYLFPYFLVGLFIFPITNLNPYYTNIKNNKHIFHPAFGEEKVSNLLASHVQVDFYNKNRFEKLFISTFSHSGDNKKITNYKIPFTFKVSEISVLYQTTIPYGGFGPFFGGLVILSFILLITSLKSLNKIPSDYIYIFSGLILSIILFPEPWLARMVPHLYLIPILLILVIDTYCTTKKSRKFLINLNLATAVLNIFLFIFSSLALNTYFSLQIHYQIDQLKKLNGKIIIPIDYAFRSNLTRFKENNIPYVVENIPFSLTNNDLHFWGPKGDKSTKFIAPINNDDKGFILKNIENIYTKIESKYYPSHKKN